MRPSVVLARAGDLFPSHEGVHVTIPRRTDTALSEPLALQGVKLLAELPHVGAPSVADSRPVFETEPTPSSSRTLKSTHPAFAELAELPEAAPAQRGPRPTRFVDRAHVDHEWEVAQPREDADDFVPRQRVSQPQRRMVHRQSHAQSARHRTGWQAIFSQTHARIAPFAGLIVTAALMASAVLLFWIMLGGQPGAKLNEFALPGDGFRVEISEPDFSTTQSVSVPPLVEADFVPTTVQPENSDYVQPTTPTQPSPLEIQPHGVPTDTSAATLQPVSEQIGEPTAPLGRLLFPVTNMPLALDYSKAVNNSAAELQELPAVAERADAATPEPINR